MGRSDSDLLAAPESELERLDDEELLRLVVISRDGDRTSAHKARRAWETLIARDVDRIRAMVESFRHPGNASVRIEPHEVDDVTQDAFVRFTRVAFRGEVMPQYRAAMWWAVTNQCKDHCRAKMTEDKHLGGSLDAEIDTGEGDPRPKYERELAEHEQRRLAEEEQVAEEMRHLRRLGDWLTDLIAQIPDEPKRRVLEMTREGRSTKEIAEALGTSEANVYQLRTRALRMIRKLLDDGK